MTFALDVCSDICKACEVFRITNIGDYIKSFSTCKDKNNISVEDFIKCMDSIEFDHWDLKSMFACALKNKTTSEVNVNALESMIIWYGKNTQQLQDELLLTMKEDVD